MREEIEKIENKIKDVSEIQDYLEKKKKELYSKYGYGAEQYKENQLWYKLEDLTYLKTVLEKLEQEKIDITKKVVKHKMLMRQLDQRVLCVRQNLLKSI